jgi:hypothetical protein
VTSFLAREDPQGMGVIVSHRIVGKRLDCAEAVAIAYQRMGLLSPEPPPNAYAPADFSAQHMKPGCWEAPHFGPQLEVLWSGQVRADEQPPVSSCGAKGARTERPA